MYSQYKNKTIPHEIIVATIWEFHPHFPNWDFPLVFTNSSA